MRSDCVVLARLWRTVAGAGFGLGFARVDAAVFGLFGPLIKPFSAATEPATVEAASPPSKSACLEAFLFR